MNKWIETYMEEKNLKPNELFKLDSQTFKDEYYFDEYGTLYRKRGNGYENPSMEIWGRLMNGFAIEKVKQKGRYIPKKGEKYYYITAYGAIDEEIYNCEKDEYLFSRDFVFRTLTEAKDYMWFLKQVDKYKKVFVPGEENYYIYYETKYKRLDISCCIYSVQDVNYFGSEENIKEFRSVVGEERICKYLLDVWR